MQTSKCSLLLLGFVTLQLAGLTVSQSTIPEGDPNFISKASYQARCATALDGSTGFNNKVIAAPAGAIPASKVDGKIKNGCINNVPDDSTDDGDVSQLSTKAGPELDRANFNSLFTSTNDQFGLLQTQKNCLDLLRLNYANVQIYPGKLLKNLGEQGVQTLNGGLYSASIVVGAPDAGTLDPAVVTIGKNIFLSASEAALGTKLKPVPVDAKSSAVSTFVNDPATRAQVALLHGIILVDSYNAESANDAAGFSRKLWANFHKKNCRYGNLDLEKRAYSLTYGLAGKYLCCLKEQQFANFG